jgi:hypothetical protein
MNKLLSLVILLFFCIFTGCYTHDESQKKLAGSDKLKVTDTLSIAIPNDVSFRAFNSQVVENEDYKLLLRENWIKNGIDIFNLNSKKYVRTITIPSEGPNALKFYNFLFHNKDTIFCFPYRGLVVSIFDWNGNFKFKKKWTLEFKHSIPQELVPMNQCPAVFSNNILSVTSCSYIYYALEPDKYYSDNFCMNYNLATDSAWAPDIYYPGSYFGNLYPVERIYSTYNFKINKFINSFSYSHYLFISDYSGIVDSVKVQSKYMSSIPHFDKYDESQEGKECFIENMYADIIYDKYRDVYYRFVALVGDEKYLNKVDIANQYLYRPFVIMLLDSNFNVLDEMKLPIGQYNYYDYFIDNKGLWVSSNNPVNSKFDENYLRYSLVTFEK